MRIKKSYKITRSGEEFTVFLNCDSVKSITLSKFGAFLIEQTSKKDASHTEMLELLLENFEISTVLALSEIDTFIKKMKENGLFEE